MCKSDSCPYCSSASSIVSSGFSPRVSGQAVLKRIMNLSFILKFSFKENLNDTYDVKHANNSSPVTVAPGAQGPKEVSRSI